MGTPATDRPGTDRPERVVGARAQARGWVLLALPVLLLVLLVAANGLRGDPDPAGGGPLTDFVLPDTAGGSFQLSEALDQGDVLLYFSMGIGCYGCFAQIPEVAHELTARGITLVPIMVDPPATVAAAAERLGIGQPIVIDADRRVSEAYGMLGVYGHADRPGHSFALVRSDGQVATVQHYAEMFVPAEQLLADLRLGHDGLNRDPAA